MFDQKLAVELQGPGSRVLLIGPPTSDGAVATIALPETSYTGLYALIPLQLLSRSEAAMRLNITPARSALLGKSQPTSKEARHYLLKEAAIARIIPYCLALMVLIGSAVSAHASEPPTIEESRTTLAFPQWNQLCSNNHAATELKQITLEYGVDQRTCGVVVAWPFPQFTPAREARVTWTWDMRRSGSLPPGATLLGTACTQPMLRVRTAQRIAACRLDRWSVTGRRSAAGG